MIGRATCTMQRYRLSDDNQCVIANGYSWRWIDGYYNTCRIIAGAVGNPNPIRGCDRWAYDNGLRGIGSTPVIINATGSYSHQRGAVPCTQRCISCNGC